MIDWQALGLAAVRTLWFMLAYFAGMVVLAMVQKYAKQTDEWLRAWAMRFSGIMALLWALVLSGAVVL